MWVDVVGWVGASSFSYATGHMVDRPVAMEVIE